MAHRVEGDSWHVGCVASCGTASMPITLGPGVPAFANCATMHCFSIALTVSH
ncbi:MAG TPA: hypothetical protein VNE82_23010 [Candidatus Binataceae bacterium]|nr:hypothetical protein [Candidatus Binataceae bacterium]